MEIDVGAGLRSALDQLELPDEGAIYEATAIVADWAGCRAILMRAFELSQHAARAESPIVYVVHGDDLLGRRGAPSAMVATGLLSAARTAAVELSRKGTSVNVVATGDSVQTDVVARWTRRLTEADGPTGELIRLDPGHLGKALP